MVFLVDRSGSMAGTKMNLTKQALQLFMKSLPPEDTYFQIISFGSNYKYLDDKARALTYDPETLDLATSKIENFSASMGAQRCSNLCNRL